MYYYPTRKRMVGYHILDNTTHIYVLYWFFLTNEHLCVHGRSPDILRPSHEDGDHLLHLLLYSSNLFWSITEV